MGTYLSTPKTEKFSEDGENVWLRYGLSSMQGWRSTMEDAHAALLDFDTSTAFFGVYDGHGGKDVAKFCAKYLHQEVFKHDSYLAGDLGASLQRAFLRMDELMSGENGWRELAVLGHIIPTKVEQDSHTVENPASPRENREDDGQINDCIVEEESHSDFSGPTSGSTACVAIIRENKLVVANAGDSRCVLCRNGQAYSLSRDHKPEVEAEKERIVNAGGFVQNGRINGTLNLTRAIGDVEFKKNKSLPAENQILTANPDINMVSLCEDDEFLVIACDGIWDCVSSQQLVDYVREQLKTETRLSAICERVFDNNIAPLAGGVGCDNMTMILIQFKKPFDFSLSARDEPLLSYPDPQYDQSEEEEEVKELQLEEQQ